MSFITRLLPRRSLSRWAGYFMHWEGPRWWARFSVAVFARLYHINISECEKPLESYPSIGAFFTRRLKTGVRPVAEAPAVHPADSVITQCAPIREGKLIQAKNFTYSLLEFTQDPEALKKWEGGLFATYYLCPTDYHRVHSPVDGDITNVRYIPGDLWPVNEWSTNNIRDLFPLNERVLVEIESEWGPVGVVFVGATNVGQIELFFDSEIRGNQAGPMLFKHKSYEPELPIHKGAELGMFRMGSTVVMLYPQVFRELYENSLERGPAVRVNAAFVKG